MDDLITLFVQSRHTEQQANDIFEMIGLLRVYNHLEPLNEIADVLMDESNQDTIGMVDKLTYIFLNAQEYLLDRHGVSLSDESTLAFNNTVLRNLYQLQHLDDPVPVLRVLESAEDDFHKFCEIMEMFSSVPITTYMQIVDTVRPICLKTLADYLYAQEDSHKTAAKDLPIIKSNVKLFTKAFGINPAVRVIIDSDTIMGEEFEMYLPLFDELRQAITDEQMLMETLVFLLLYSSDGSASPLETYNAYSSTLVPDLLTANRLSKAIAEKLTAMARYKESNQ